MKGLCVVLDNYWFEKEKDLLEMGLMLFAKKGNKHEVIRPPKDAVLGERVYFDGDKSIDPRRIEFDINEGEVYVEECMDQLSTDENGIVLYKDKKLRVKSGFLTARTLKKAKIIGGL